MKNSPIKAKKNLKNKKNKDESYKIAFVGA